LSFVLAVDVAEHARHDFCVFGGQFNCKMDCKIGRVNKPLKPRIRRLIGDLNKKRIRPKIDVLLHRFLNFKFVLNLHFKRNGVRYKMPVSKKMT